MARLGIDISKHQGDIDLASLKNEIDFVIIRVGYGTKGTIDTKFKRNVDLCIQLGIPFGFYWYSYTLDINGAKKEAEAFINAINPYKDKYSYGCWFDMEDADGYKSKNGMPSNDMLQDICVTFCETVENSGYYVGIYASQSWFNNQLSGDKLNPYDKWIAQWLTSGGKQKGLSVSPDDKSGVSLWQFTSQAKFNGYSSTLDANYAYKDYPNLIGNTSVNNNSLSGTTLELVERTMNDEFGDGDVRKNSLGSRYQEIQDFINHISNSDINTLVEETLNGKYGNGETRKIVLGDRYQDVQNIINNNSERVYIVKSGDTLSEIGNKLGINWKDIANKNGISSPYTIYPGQSLKY